MVGGMLEEGARGRLEESGNDMQLVCELLITFLPFPSSPPKPS